MADKKSTPKKETSENKTYAIVEASGKQFWLQPNRYYDFDRCQAEVDDVLTLENVLLLNDNKNTEIGNPSIEGATVEAKLLDNVKDRTVLVFHKRRRKHSRKKNGHRQRHSKVQITKILAKGGKIIDEFKIVEKKNVVKEDKKVIKKEEKK